MTSSQSAITAIVFNALSIILIITYLLYSNKTIKKILNTPRTSMLNTFPAELNDSKNGVIQIAILALASLFTLTGFAFYFVGVFTTQRIELVKSVYYFEFAFCIINAICMYLTGFISYKKSVKLPITLNVIFIFSVIAIGVFMPFLPTEELKDTTGIFDMNSVIAWIGFALAIISAIPLINPKLNDWYKLEKTEVDGATIYVRPKINWLATYIWGAFIATALFQLLFGINSILVLIN